MNNFLSSYNDMFSLVLTFSLFTFLNFGFVVYFFNKNNQKCKDNNDEDNEYLNNNSKLFQYTFIVSKYKIDESLNDKGYCVNHTFDIKNKEGLSTFQTYFSDNSNTLLLFEGNRIGLFLNDAELDVLPSLSDSLKYNHAYGFCKDIFKSDTHCSVLVMNYVPSYKTWMLLDIPALLNVPTENDDDNSMYPDKMVKDAKSEWINHILDIIDIPYEYSEDEEEDEIKNVSSNTDIANNELNVESESDTDSNTLDSVNTPNLENEYTNSTSIELPEVTEKTHSGPSV